MLLFCYFLFLKYFFLSFYYYFFSYQNPIFRILHIIICKRPWIYICSRNFLSRQRPYHVESTASRPISEVKQRCVWIVLGWVTAWEHQMLLVIYFLNCQQSFHLRPYFSLFTLQLLHPCREGKTTRSRPVIGRIPSLGGWLGRRAAGSERPLSHRPRLQTRLTLLRLCFRGGL